MMQSSFHFIDWLIVIAYLAAMAGVGIYFSRRQTSIEHYLLADRNMAWLPVGLSLMAALNSGMDYLMQPSATITYGFVLVIGTLSWLVLYPWVAKVAIPFYRRLNSPARRWPSWMCTTGCISARISRAESRLWRAAFGLVATLVVGGTLALLWPASPSSKGRDLTWPAVMQRPNL